MSDPSPHPPSAPCPALPSSGVSRCAGRTAYWTYPVVLTVLVTVWAVVMTVRRSWGLFSDLWPMSVTMVFGSFVAGSTPAGGGSVAFPVFTKVLSIPAGDAAVFGLMIQSVGMSMASLFILTRGIRVSLRVWRPVALSGSAGVIAGLVWLRLPPPYPKLLYSCLICAFGIVLYRSHWRRRRRRVDEVSGDSGTRKRLLVAGLLGGVVASQVGCGTDMVAFILVTMAFGLCEKVAVPTSVLVMAWVSLVGFAAKLAGAGPPIGPVWDYWLACVPVVAVGAPFGAWVMTRLNADTILGAVIVLIAIEFLTTVWIVRLDGPRLAFMALVLAGSYFLIHRLRNLRADPGTRSQGADAGEPS